MKDYTPAQFTRDNPVTKVELHNCFYRDGRYVNRLVIEARAEIGLNAPKYLIREGFVVARTIEGKDYYCPTAAGDNWLRTGILRYLALHPDRAKECKYLPAGYSVKRKPPKIVRRSKPIAAPVQSPSLKRRTRPALK